MENFAIETEKIGELENFRQEIKKIKTRLVDDRRKAGNDEYDATLAEVDVDKLGEAEMEIWEEYKNIFSKVEDSFNSADDTWTNVQEQNVNPLVEKIKKILDGANNGTLSNGIAQFYGWLNNRVMPLMYQVKRLLDQEKLDVFGEAKG